MFNWAQLLVQLLNAWAWPIVALIAMAMVRPHMGAIIGRIRAMKGLGIEVSLEEAQKALVESQLPPPAPSPQGTEFGQFDVGTQLLQTWREVEDQIQQLVIAYEGTPGPTSKGIEYLLSKRIIDKPFASSVDSLRAVRNSYVHGSDSVDVSQIIAFVALARQISKRLEQMLIAV
jgi:hypothetical protein